MNLYGLSESSGASICTPVDERYRFDLLLNGSIGVPLDNYQVMVVDQHRKQLNEGEVGELIIKGDCVCNGYIGLEEETKKTFKNGWLYTGDIAYIKEGYVYLMGRKKEMYIQGGYNVYPAEIESVLLKHPKISLAAVIGVPNEFYGEIGVAYIVPKEEITEEKIKKYCAEHIADYKIPKKIIFTETLPLTPVGKIEKAVLLKQYLESSKKKKQ